MSAAVQTGGQSHALPWDETTVTSPGAEQHLPRGVADAALTRLFPQPDPYTHDPVGWVQNKLGRFLWSKQKEIMEAVRDHRYVAVKSCHGPGKSFTASSVVSWWLDVHAIGDAFAVTTAPSTAQVEAILWREIRRRFKEGELTGRITQDCKWHMNEGEGKAHDETEELIAMGRKPQDYDETTFQGIHARYFLAVLDEAGGIPEALWTSVLALATNENSRILAIGNPDDPNSHFARICRPGSGWHVIQISAFDTPNFTGEYVPPEVAENLVSQMWVEDRRRDWGEGSPTWVAKVEGEFPDVSDEYIISPTHISKARATEIETFARGRYGMDVARQGRDKTVIYRNRDGQVRLVEEWAGADTMQSAGKARNVLRRHGIHRVPMVIDIIGLGAGVFDRLREQNFEVIPYQGSQAASRPNKFKNRRSEMWWTFRELIEAGAIDIDPEDDKLADELQSPKWGVDSSGRIWVESKEDMLARGIRSPNRADAAIMSCFGRNNLREVGAVNGHSSLTGDLLTKVM